MQISYDAWKATFDAEASRRANVCDESRTVVSKIDDMTALVMMFNVDIERVSMRGFS